MGIQLRQVATSEAMCKYVTGSKQDEQVTSLSSPVSTCVYIYTVYVHVFICLFRHGSPLSVQWEIFMQLKAWLPWQHNEMLIEWRPVWFAPLLIPPLREARAKANANRTYSIEAFQ